MINYGNTTYQAETLEYNTLESGETLNYELTKLNFALLIQDKHTREPITTEESSQYVNLVVDVITIDPNKKPSFNKTHIHTGPCNETHINEMLFESSNIDWGREKLLEIQNELVCLEDPAKVYLQG